MINFEEVSTALGTFATIITAFGGAGVWLYRKQNKRLKESETKLSEVQVEKAKIEAKADDWHLWQEQLNYINDHNRSLSARIKELQEMLHNWQDKHQQAIKDWQERFDNQTDRLREVQRALVQSNQEKITLAEEKAHAIEEKAQLQKERDHYYFWRCFREQGNEKSECSRRKPKQSIPIKYTPLVKGENREPAENPSDNPN